MYLLADDPLNSIDPNGFAQIGLPGGHCFRIPFTKAPNCKGADGPTKINCIHIPGRNDNCDSLWKKHPEAHGPLIVTAVVAGAIAVCGTAAGGAAVEAILERYVDGTVLEPPIPGEPPGVPGEAPAGPAGKGPLNNGPTNRGPNNVRPGNPRPNAGGPPEFP